MLNSIKTVAILYATITILVLGPAIGTGFTFLLDMPWPVHFQVSDYTVSGLEPHLALHGLLSILNIIIPAWMLQKLVLFTILFLSGTFTYMLMRYVVDHYVRYAQPHFAALLSGLIAILNPFVFERLAAGQWIVLAGYAYTPLVLLTYMKYKNSKRFWIVYALYPLVSIHFWLMYSIIGVLCLILFDRPALGKVLKQSRFYVWFFIINAFWIISLFSGNNQPAEGLSRNHFAAFQTLPDPNVGLLGNVISLHGMWAAQSSLLKDTNHFWFAYAICLFAASAYGMYFTWRIKRLRRFVTASVIISFVAILVAIGYAHPISRALLTPVSYLPFAATLRESAKAIGILALVYAVWAPIGITALASKQWSKTALKSAALLHIIMMSGMFWGLAGSLKNYDYPRDWYTVSETISQDSKVLILPWQGYLELEFADNAYVANPARAFFPFEVMQSTSTGNQLIDGQGSEVRSLLNEYLDGKVSYQQLTELLKTDYAITHIIILKTGNWQRYQPLAEEAKNTNKIVVDLPDITAIEL